MFVLLSLLLSSSALAAPAPTFRGFTFGEACPSGEGWSMLEESQDVQVWSRAGEKLVIGDAAITEVSYVCWRGATPAPLQGVLVSFEQSQATTLLVTLTAQWGKPSQANPYIPTYLWAGPVRAYLNSSDGVLLITHVATWKLQEADIKARAAAAGADL